MNDPENEKHSGQESYLKKRGVSEEEAVQNLKDTGIKITYDDMSVIVEQATIDSVSHWMTQKKKSISPEKATEILQTMIPKIRAGDRSSKMMDDVMYAMIVWRLTRS